MEIAFDRPFRELPTCSEGSKALHIICSRWNWRARLEGRDACEMYESKRFDVRSLLDEFYSLAFSAVCDPLNPQTLICFRMLIHAVSGAYIILLLWPTPKTNVNKSFSHSVLIIVSILSRCFMSRWLQVRKQELSEMWKTRPNPSIKDLITLYSVFVLDSICSAERISRFFFLRPES